MPEQRNDFLPHGIVLKGNEVSCEGVSSWSLEGFHLAFQEAKISTWKEGFLDGLSLGSRHLTYEKENIYPHARRWYQKQGVTSEEDKLGHLHKTQCGGLQLPASQPPPRPTLTYSSLGPEKQDSA